MKKDMLGNEVKTGDVLIEVGLDYGGDGERDTFGVTVWEMPKHYNFNGISYRMGGVKGLFYYAQLRNSIKINPSEMPEGFTFSFYNGMSEFDSYVLNRDAIDTINNSNWKQYEVSQKKVDDYVKLNKLTINSINDIKGNIDLFLSTEVSEEKYLICYRFLLDYLHTKQWFMDGLNIKWNRNYWSLLKCLKNDLENNIK